MADVIANRWQHPDPEMNTKEKIRAFLKARIENRREMADNEARRLSHNLPKNLSKRLRDGIEIVIDSTDDERAATDEYIKFLEEIG